MGEDRRVCLGLRERERGQAVVGEESLRRGKAELDGREEENVARYH